MAAQAPFYSVSGVPANSVLLMRTEDQARTVPKGNIELVFDPGTGFIANRAFDESIVDYSEEYEATQAFSATFSAFHQRLAQDLINRYDLHQKTIVEIGCGMGEFLTLLCELGDNRGIGFDPAYRPSSAAARDERLTFVQDVYSEAYANVRADFVCCKMTLEHIADVDSFVGTVRRAIGEAADTVVFFQVPEVRRVLQDLAFWDIYHEHCSYFSAASLARLFQQQGFAVINLWTDYDDQYLMIEAKPRGEARSAMREGKKESTWGDLKALRREVETFAERVGPRIAAWTSLLTKAGRAGRRVVLWGGGSKAVAFLTTLNIGDEVACAVDINPRKQGTYLAGTGHEIVAPEALAEDPPDAVIVMNPIYRTEIQSQLRAMELEPEIWPVDADPAALASEDASKRIHPKAV